MGQIEDAFRDAADEVAQIKAQPSNRYWWLYGTIKKKNENGTLDVAIDGVTIQQVKATVSCMMANVGDRVIVLKAGPLMTCVDVIATSDEVKVPASSITGTLPVANGGTGASSAEEALTSIGAASATELAEVRDSVSQLKYSRPCEVLFLSTVENQFGIQVTDKKTGNIGFITIKEDNRIHAAHQINGVWGEERIL